MSSQAYDSFSPQWQDPYFKAGFALHVLKLVALLGLVGTTCLFCRGWSTAESRRPTFFGFRSALLFLEFYTLILVIYTGVNATMRVSIYFDIFWILGMVAYGIGRAMLVYALIKITLHPLHSTGIHRNDKRLALGTSAFSAMGSLVLVIILVAWDASVIDGDDIAPSDTIDTLFRAKEVMRVIDSAIHMIVGIIVLGAAILAWRKSAHLDIHPDRRCAVTLVMAAASLWVVSGVIITVLNSIIEAPIFDNGSGRFLDDTTITVQLGVDIVDFAGQTAMLALVTACFREGKDMLPL